MTEHSDKVRLYVGGEIEVAPREALRLVRELLQQVASSSLTGAEIREIVGAQRLRGLAREALRLGAGGALTVGDICEVLGAESVERLPDDPNAARVVMPSGTLLNSDERRFAGPT